MVCVSVEFVKREMSFVRRRDKLHEVAEEIEKTRE